MTDLSFYRNRKIFVTGHTGFKGTWLCRVLLQAGADITGYAIDPPTKPSIFIQTKTEKDIHSITGDIRDREKLINAVRTAKPEIVFHLAAQPLVRVSYHEPVVTYETNVMGTVNILEAVRVNAADNQSIKSFVNVTTDKVYENREWSWGYRENENLCGFDPYSNSKSCSELATISYRNSFFTEQDSPAVSTARSGNVIGGGDYAADRIIPDCLRAADMHTAILLRNPDSIRPYQHVLECLSGYLLLAEKQYGRKDFSGSYNFGPDDKSCVTTGRLAELFCNAWGHGISCTAQKSNGPHEAKFLKLDCSKAKNILDWKPVWNIETTIQKIVEWNRNVSSGMSAADVTDNQIREYFDYAVKEIRHV